MLPATVLLMAVAALAAPAPSNGNGGVDGLKPIRLMDYGFQHSSNSSILAARDDYPDIEGGLWADGENYLYTKNGSPCDAGCYVKVTTSRDKMEAYSVGSSGYGDDRTKPDDFFFKGGETIFSVEQAFTDSYKTGCWDGKCTMIGGNTKTYNTYQWPGACTRNVVSDRLDNGLRAGSGQLHLNMQWAALEDHDDKERGLFNLMYLYIEKTFMNAIAGQDRDLRRPGFNNRGNCAYTNGVSATYDKKPIRYQSILRGVSATILKKADRSAVFTLKNYNGVCDPKTYSDGVCDLVNAATSLVEFLPGFVNTVSSVLCEELTPESKSDVEKC